MKPEVISNIIAGISLLFSLTVSFFYFRDRRQAKFLLMNEYSKQIMEWYSETIEVLLLLGHRTRKNTQRTELLAKLSALIERGRFFFPNIDKQDGFGAKKPTAYQGYRNLALDFLVASYNLYGKKNHANFAAEADQLRRYFTSIIFEVVRPKENLDRIKAITDRFYVKEQIFEDFLQSHDSKLIEFIWKKQNA
jgi:hypothetical protein